MDLGVTQFLWSLLLLPLGWLWKRLDSAFKSMDKIKSDVTELQKQVLARPTREELSDILKEREAHSQEHRALLRRHIDMMIQEMRDGFNRIQDRMDRKQDRPN